MNKNSCPVTLHGFNNQIINQTFTVNSDMSLMSLFLVT